MSSYMIFNLRNLSPSDIIKGFSPGILFCFLAYRHICIPGDGANIIRAQRLPHYTLTDINPDAPVFLHHASDIDIPGRTAIFEYRLQFSYLWSGLLPYFDCVLPVILYQPSYLIPYEILLRK